MLPNYRDPGISENFAELYKDGLSLADIAKQTGKAKNTIRAALEKAGIELRANVSLPVHRSRKLLGKKNIRPFYGFCYFQARVVPDPREHENLFLIHRLWKLETNPNRIADILNEKKIPAGSAAAWTRNSVVLILQRFESGIISIKGGKCLIQ